MINQLPQKLIQPNITRQKSFTYCPQIQDRFIPNRRNTTGEEYKFKPNFKISDEIYHTQTQDNEQEYQQILRNNLLFQEQNKQNKVLNFSNKDKKRNGKQKRFGLEKKQRLKNYKSTAKEILEIPGFEDQFYYNNISVSEKNQIAIVLSNKLYIFDRNNHKVIDLYEAYDCEAITSVQWNQEGNLLSFGNELGEVQIWDVEKQKEIKTFEDHQSRVGCLDWNQYLISGSKDTNIFMYDMRLDDPIVSQYKSHTSEICSLKWSPSQQYFAAGASDGKMQVWSLKNQVPIMKGSHDSTVKALDWSHFQNGILFSGGGIDDCKLKIWNINKQELQFERHTGSQICSIASSKETNDVFTAQGYPNFHIDVWRAKGLKRITSLKGHKDRVLHLQISHKNQQLISVSSDESLRIWDISKKENRKKEKLDSQLSLDMPKILRQNNCFQYYIFFLLNFYLQLKLSLKNYLKKINHHNYTFQQII